MFDIITDTSSNLDARMLKDLHVRQIPFSFLIGGEVYTSLQNETFDGKTFYENMRAGTEVKTSQITPQQYAETMEPILREGRDVLFVSMSSGISGSFDSSRIAAKQLSEDYPDRKILSVDTIGASLGEGLLVLEAARMRDRGFSVEETAAVLEKRRYEMCQVFTVDDLKYLKNTGRLSNWQYAMSSLLQIKPLLKGDREGKIVCFARQFGRKNAIRGMAEQYELTVRDPEAQTIGIAHADCPEDAEYLISLLRAKKPPKDILLVSYEPVTGSHVGPGALALFYFGTPDFRVKTIRPAAPGKDAVRAGLKTQGSRPVPEH